MFATETDRACRAAAASFRLAVSLPSRCQANPAALLAMRLRRIETPATPRPASIIIHVAGSGTGAVAAPNWMAKNAPELFAWKSLRFRVNFPFETDILD